MWGVLSYLLLGVAVTALGTLLGVFLKDWWDKRWENVPEEEIRVLKRLSNASQGCLPGSDVRDTLKSYELPKGKVDSIISGLKECCDIRWEDRGKPYFDWYCITPQGRTTLREKRRRRVKRGHAIAASPPDSRV